MRTFTRSRKLQVTYTTNAITARVIHFLKHDADASDPGVALVADFVEGMPSTDWLAETVRGEMGAGGPAKKWREDLSSAACSTT